MIAWQALQHGDQAVQTRIGLHLSSPLDLAESQLAVDQAAIDLADARAGHSLAYVALFKALGGAPLPADAAAEKSSTTSSVASPSSASASDKAQR